MRKNTSVTLILLIRTYLRCFKTHTLVFKIFCRIAIIFLYFCSVPNGKNSVQNYFPSPFITKTYDRSSYGTNLSFLVRTIKIKSVILFSKIMLAISLLLIFFFFITWNYNFLRLQQYSKQIIKWNFSSIGMKKFGRKNWFKMEVLRVR